MSENAKETVDEKILKHDFNITIPEFLSYKKVIHSNIDSILDYELETIKAGFSIIEKYDTLDIDVGAYKIVERKLKLIEEKLTKIKDATINLGR